MHCLVAFWMPQTASETVSGSCNEQFAQFTTKWQTVLWPVVAFSKTSFKYRSIQIKGNFTKLTLHLYLMEVIPLCDIIQSYTNIYVNTQLLLYLIQH